MTNRRAVRTRAGGSGSWRRRSSPAPHRTPRRPIRAAPHRPSAARWRRRTRGEGTGGTRSPLWSRFGTDRRAEPVSVGKEHAFRDLDRPAVLVRGDGFDLQQARTLRHEQQVRCAGVGGDGGDAVIRASWRDIVLAETSEQRPPLVVQIGYIWREPCRGDSPLPAHPDGVPQPDPFELQHARRDGRTARWGQLYIGGLPDRREGTGRGSSCSPPMAEHAIGQVRYKSMIKADKTRGRPPSDRAAGHRLFWPATLRRRLGGV